jgi:hypothetical protein
MLQENDDQTINVTKITHGNARHKKFGNPNLKTNQQMLALHVASPHPSNRWPKFISPLFYKFKWSYLIIFDQNMW